MTSLKLVSGLEGPAGEFWSVLEVGSGCSGCDNAGGWPGEMPLKPPTGVALSALVWPEKAVSKLQNGSFLNLALLCLRPRKKKLSPF